MFYILKNLHAAEVNCRNLFYYHENTLQMLIESLNQEVSASSLAPLDILQNIICHAEDMVICKQNLL